MDFKDKQMREKIAVFGGKGSLVGIASEPESGVKTDIYPGIIFLNSGLLHRVGPNRLYVNLARNLALAGFVAMRFDLSGIGDSQRTDSLPYEESAINDIRLAMNFLSETYGIRSFLLIGICSGADNAFQAARIDPRVVGIVMVDGFSFTTAGYIMSSYLKSLLKFQSWRRLLSGKSEILQFIKAKLTFLYSSDLGDSEPMWPVPNTDDIRAGITILAENGLDLYFIFSAGGGAHYNFKRIYAKTIASLAELQRIHVKLFENTDHLFSPLYVQESLVKAITGWIVHATRRKNKLIQMTI
jgi:pimeloyl-ACP methyl ester carboxylesterase